TTDFPAAAISAATTEPPAPEPTTITSATSATSPSRAEVSTIIAASRDERRRLLVRELAFGGLSSEPRSVVADRLPGIGKAVVAERREELQRTKDDPARAERALHPAT